jgi:hypothetical protein
MFVVLCKSPGVGSQQNLSDVDPVLLGPGWLIEKRQFDSKMALSKGFPLFHHVFSTELYKISYNGVNPEISRQTQN